MSNNKQKSFNDLCKSLEKIAIEANKIIASRKDVESENSFLTNLYQNTYKFELDFNEFDKTLDYTSLINVLNVISNDETPTSVFKILSVSFLGHKILNSGCVEHLNSKQNDTIMKCCQIELDSNGYYYNGDKYDSNFFKWKSFICSLLAHYYCNEKLLNENIHAIQRYFEFSCSQIKRIENYDNPYYYAVSGVSKAVGDRGIYFNLLGNQQLQKSQCPLLIRKYKEFVINGSLINETNRQFKFLIKSSESDNVYPIADNFYEEIIDAILDGFIQSKDEESKKLCLNTAIDFAYNLEHYKTTKQKESQVFLVQKTLELAQHLFEQKYDSGHAILNLFDRYLSSIASFIFKNGKTNASVLLKPTLDLIVNVLKLNNSTFNPINQFFRINGFFNLANYSTECIQMLNELISIIYANKQIKETSDLIDYYVEIVKIFKQVIEKIHPVLFEKAICIPIEQNIEQLKEPYDKFLESLLSLYSFEIYPKPTDSNELDRLEKLIFRLSTDECFERFQADKAPWWYQPSAFYLSFFTNLTSNFGKRTDLVERFEPAFLKLLEKLVEKNEFFDKFLNPNGGLLINFRILLVFTNQLLLTKNSSHSKLVNKIIEIWIFIKEQDLDDEVIKQCDSFIQTAAFHYPDQVADFAEKIYDYYLNDTSFLFTATSIFPFSLESFKQKGIDSKFHAKCLSDSNFLISNYNLLYSLLSKMPGYFIHKEAANRQIRLFELCQSGQKNRDNNIQIGINTLNLMYSLIEQLKQPNIYVNDLFTDRKHIQEFQYFIREKKSALPAYITESYVLRVIGNYYKMLSIHESQIGELVTELIQMSQNFAPTDSSILLLDCKEICVSKNRIDLLKKNKEIIYSMRKHSEIQEIIQSICDFIEDRNLEVIDTKLTKNIENVVVLDNSVKETTKKVVDLNQKVKTQQKNITVMKTGIKNIGEKLNDLGEVVTEHDGRIEQLDSRTISNVPSWGKEISSILNRDWILVAKRLNYNESDLKAWLTQSEPCMCMLQEWFMTNKTSDAIKGLIKCLKAVNQLKCVKIIESSIQSVENLDETAIDTQLVENPPDIFITFEWSTMQQALLLKKYLDEVKFINSWFDDGKMGGGNARNSRIDMGLRKCQVLICLITSEASKDETCLNQINLAVQLGKPIIPLLLDSKLKWPPQGSLGPILSEYLFIRFFQRPNEITGDERYWPVDKFNELIMQLKCLIPTSTSQLVASSPSSKIKIKMPEVFISYQWDKQKQIIQLFKKFQSIGINCWLDIYQMGGGDSLYDKIDKGLRNCLLVVSCVTIKYGLSANCRKEIALADSLSKPILPILLESMNYPPSGPMAPTLSVLKYTDFTKDEKEQETWNGDSFKELLERMRPYLPSDIFENTKSKACLIS